MWILLVYAIGGLFTIKSENETAMRAIFETFKHNPIGSIQALDLYNPMHELVHQHIVVDDGVVSIEAEEELLEFEYDEQLRCWAMPY
jgi:hypothetical protein